MRPSQFRQACRQGFTLIELSIVLVIVALLIGGILTGQDLMQASRLQAVVKDATDIRDAFHTFKDKYGAYPGDLSNAKDLWSGCVDMGGNPCNGDGDGQIWCCSTSSFMSERVRAWQHLSFSGIIPGKYDGTYATLTPDVNVYRSPLEGYFWLPGWWTTFNHSNNFIAMAGVSGTGPALTATDAKSIDQKVDDGIAFRGRMFGVSDSTDTSFGCPFYDAGKSGNPAPQDYNVSHSAKECNIRFNWLDDTVDQ